MATQVVEMSGDEAALFRSLSKVIAKEAEHEKQLAATGDEGAKLGAKLEASLKRAGRSSARELGQLLGDLNKIGPAGVENADKLRDALAKQGNLRFSGIDTIIEDIRKLAPEAAAAAEILVDQFRQVDEQAGFTNTLQSLRAIGPEGAKVATKLEADLKTAELNAAGGMNVVLNSLREISPLAGQIADDVARELGEADRKSEFQKTLVSLQRLGPEGSAIAKGIETDLKAAEAVAAGGMDEILAKLRELDPVASASAERVKAELAEAAKFSEGKFEDTLGTLRSMGPVGKQVAAELRKSLVDAGEISERSIEDVIAEIRKIDPAAAQAATAIHTKLSNAADKSESAFMRFGTSAVGQITAVAGSYLGIQEAIQRITGYMREQEEVLKSSLDKQISLAKAQQESAKNLAGLTAVERDSLLQQAVPDIARSTGFGDVSAITTAIGSAVSRGADSRLAADAVRQAARIEVNTPEQLADTASGAVALQLQTGLSDIRQSIALIETTGTQAAITDPRLLIEALPKAIGSAVATVRSQDREEASRQSAALFAQITQSGNDSQGKSSATFQTDLTVRLEKLFTGFEDELIDARSKIDLIDRKIAKGSDTEANRRDRADLQAFVDKGQSVQKEFSGTAAFETLFGRIETLQRNPEIAKQFLGKEGFGEKQFQVALKDLFDSTSDAAIGLKAKFDIIQANAGFFEQEAANIASGTPQLALANFQNRSTAGQSAQLTQDSEGAALSALGEAVATTLVETRTGGVGGFVSAQVDETGIRSGIAAGSTTAEEAVGLINTLLGRRNAFAADGITAEETPKIQRIDAQIESIRSLIETNSGVLAPGSIGSASGRAKELASDFAAAGAQEQAKFFSELAAEFRKVSEAVERQNAIAERQVIAAEETAANTTPTPASQPNYGNIQRAGR